MECPFLNHTPRHVRKKKKKCTMMLRRGHQKHKGNQMIGNATTPVPQYYVFIVELCWCQNHSYGSLDVIDAPNTDISVYCILIDSTGTTCTENSFLKKKNG